MGFGNKAPKSDRPKKVNVQTDNNKEIRENLIIDRIKGIGWTPKFDYEKLIEEYCRRLKNGK